MTLDNYYVYGYVDPATHVIRYIGKGRRDRIGTHFQRAKRGNYRVENKKLDQWLKQLIEAKREPIMVKLAQRLTEQEAFALERTLIAANKSLWLCNKKKGGTL